MNNLIRSPILVFVLVSCFNRKRRSLHREIRLARLFWFNFETFEFSLMLCFLFYSMRINDLMLFFNIKWLKFMGLSYCLHSIISSMFSLILCMDTFGIMIPNMFINHLSSPRSSHVMLIIINKINRCFF